MAHRGRAPLPRHRPVADLRRRRRLQRLPGPRAWKIELAQPAAETGLAITVCHLPPGSKWTKIEHRLFSQITVTWRGRPLETHQMNVDLIGNTTTTTGLTVNCVLDTDPYPTGIKYTTKDVDALPITRHDFHGEWNYTVQPATRP